VAFSETLARNSRVAQEFVKMQVSDCLIPTEVTEERIVTYQLAMSGSDGILVASDRCENIGSLSEKTYTKNLIRKISVANGLAWTYSGTDVAPIFSSRFREEIERLGNEMSLENVQIALDNSSRRTASEYQPTSRGPWSACLTVVRGESKTILRNKLSLRTDEVLGGWCVSGQEFNLAAFIPRRFYSPGLTVNELAHIAAYSIRAAHDLDNAMIDGLDIAIYRSAEGIFNLLEDAEIERLWNEAASLDKEMLKLFRATALSAQF
jgi:hypothetical protein